MYFEGFANADKKKMNEEQLDRYKEKLELYKDKVNHYKNLIKESMLDSNEPDNEDEDEPVNKSKEPKDSDTVTKAVSKANKDSDTVTKAVSKANKDSDTVTKAVSKGEETGDSDESDEEDEPKNPNIEGFSNFSNRKIERFGGTSSSSDWNFPTSPRFYLNVGLRSLLFSCLFYIFAHYETIDYLKKAFKLSKDGSLYVLMAMFFVFYFALNIFL